LFAAGSAPLAGPACFTVKSHPQTPLE